MKRAIVAILCFGFVMGNTAFADLEEGDWAPDIEAGEWINTDEPVSLQELRGMVVALFFWVSWHPVGEQLLPLMNYMNSKRVGRARGLYIMGLTDADRAQVAQMLQEQKVFFPVGVESNAYREYEINEFPRVVLIDPNGRVAWSGWPGGGGNELYEAVMDILRETPATKTHPRDAIVVHRQIEEATEALENGRLLQAFNTAKEALDLALTGDPLKTECRELLEVVEAIGRDRYAQAIEAADNKDFDEAVRILREVQDEFGGLAAAQAARRELNRLEEQYDEVKRILEQIAQREEAETILADAFTALRDEPRRIGEAYELLERIVKEYEGTSTAGKAQTILSRMRNNEAIMGYVRDYRAQAECEMLLAQAASYANTGRPERAREILRRVMRQYADTIYFEEAADRLAELP